MALFDDIVEILRPVKLPTIEELYPEAPVTVAKIITTHIRPPIPTTAFDWSAVFSDYDGAPDSGFQPIGHGKTEQEAIADLLAEQRMHEEDLEQEAYDNGQFGVGA